MDGLHSIVAEHPPHPAMPVASAIYWMPADASAAAQAGGASLPIFIRQGVLVAIQDHIAAGAGAASLGLLVGDLCEGLDGARYLMVESTISLPWRVAGDHTTPVIQDALAAAEPELRKSGGQLVGWYHSHWLAHPTLSSSDAETHRTFFGQPWQIALVVVPRERPVGGVYRSSTGPRWASEPLPFFELVSDASLLPGGGKLTDLAWDNYATAADAVPASQARRLPAAPAPPPPPRPQRLLFPMESDDAAPLAPQPRLTRRRAARFALYGAVGLLAAAGLLNVYEVVAARWSPRAVAGTRDSVAPAAPSAVDRAADTLALALAAFDVRARLFEQRQMGCPELSRGLIEVEERWITYNGARKYAPALDSARTARDRSEYADVDAVERRFERSQCARP